MNTLALYSNKGGVGKTATAVNLAYLAARDGLRTLICDLDPQSSATFYFRVKPKLKRRARGFLHAGKQIERSIKGTDYPNLDLLPADFTHRNLDINFHSLKRSTRRLEMVLKPLRKEYDLIVLDCPPTINILAENIINAADRLMVPMIPTTLSVRTLEQFLEFLNQSGYNRYPVAVLFSMVDGRKKIHNETMQSLQERFTHSSNHQQEEKSRSHDVGRPEVIVLQTSIPYLSLVEQMGIFREPLPAFAPNSDASKAYHSLWEEVRRQL